MKDLRPTVKVHRICVRCDKPFMSGYTHDASRIGHGSVWRLYRRCKRCEATRSRHYRRKYRARVRASQAKTKARPNYGAGTWWKPGSPSLLLYHKLRQSGIERDDALTEALKLFNKPE